MTEAERFELCSIREALMTEGLPARARAWLKRRQCEIWQTFFDREGLA